MEDEKIIALYWERDEQAIAETNQKYGGYCHTIAMNILSSREDSEECVSDTWQRAWNTMPPQQPLSLRSYLGRIVRNLSISRYRAARAQKRFAGLEQLLSELDDCVPAPASVVHTVEVQELSERISDWLEQLPREDRVLFVRRYWYGEPLKDLAQEHGFRPNRLAQRMLALRRSLKATLEQEGIAL